MTMYLNRLLNLNEELQKKSILLVGARQIGKSSLIRNTLQHAKKYNLLEADTFLRLQRDPALIRKELKKNDQLIVIDEVQKIPDLLDEVHLLIEEFNVRFLLTGSSLRRFSSKGINRLGGRLRTKYLLPFSIKEIGEENFHLKERLLYGLIPFIYTSSEPVLDLKSYLSDYIQGEVVAEGAVRNIPAFGRFLEIAALQHGEMINYQNIANDSQVARTTVIDYYKVLTHTLVGNELPAWGESKKRKPINTSKYYLIDNGVVNALIGRSDINLKSPEAGHLFEGYIFHELNCFKNYVKDISIHYWRSTSGFEVDFILNDEVAIEVKLTSNISKQHLKGLTALMEEEKLKRFILVSQVKDPIYQDGVEVLPWGDFLTLLWSGDIV